MTQLRPGMHLIGLCLALLVLGSALAQEATTLNPAAQESLAEGRAVVAEAMDTYIAHYPDQALWQQAIRLGREAQRQAAGHPEPLRFLAEVYTTTHWYGPAWNTWMAYLDAGGTLDESAQEAVAMVGNELGFINYEQGQLDEALRYYRQVIDLAPDNLQAYKWVGRILIETERPAQAIPYWRTVVERSPGEEGAAYFLELAQDQAQLGVDAVNAFREGVALYEEGVLERARERFARATSLNREYAEAWAWLGRVAFDQTDYVDAATYYGRATELEPGNETYRYFFEEAQRRQSPDEQQVQRTQQQEPGAQDQTQEQQ